MEKVKEEVEFKKIEEINSKPIKKNKDGYCIIELFDKEKVKVGETIVDEDNYYDLIKYKLSLNNSGYVSCTNNRMKYSIHRYIMNYTGDNYIDHINNKKLDNRICNLRIVTPHQNSMNCSSSKNSTSKYIGVCYDNNNTKWLSQITINNGNKFLGHFTKEIDSAKARDKANKEHFGEYGKLNFPE